MVTCPTCKAPVAGSKSFCTKCGTKLTVSPGDPNVIRFQPALAASVKFSPDGKTLPVALNINYEYGTQLIDVVSGSVGARLKTGPKTAVNAIAFSPDGRPLATGGYDVTIRIWSLPEGRIVHQFHAENVNGDNSLYALNFSPDGRSLASGYRDMSLRMWLLPDSLFAP